MRRLLRVSDEARAIIIWSGITVAAVLIGCAAWYLWHFGPQLLAVL